MSITIDNARCDWCLSHDATRYEDEYGVDIFCTLCWHAVHVSFPTELDKEIVENAYPDGWSCNDCADEWHGEMPTIRNAATICERCAEDEDI